ncbi:NAD(P)-dependent oxidoreductase [Streptomyces mashuensis]|uniref:dTDP-4-dehydrorhamnose reductase n=1 Tax=Streptomyces mashuensis TaxID=33904 RepID=A0A919B679_9ACTN|nr:dTDP-4-dehydrorhamnose reductase [Streptomyces mashuensis]GHF52682.1 NAD(P)-dependent oxidoreductase [Streptomyces mashuensis]
MTTPRTSLPNTFPVTGFRWLVVGAGGTLGRAVTARLSGLGADVVALARDGLDITDGRAVDEAVGAVRPGVVVNCAAWTAVDDAEAREEAAARVNADGPRHLAAACAAAGSRLVHVSTDYVFDGAGRAGVPYDEDDAPGPRTAYGRTKLAGEHAVLTGLPDAAAVVRTAWLYGEDAHGTGPTGFVGTMARIATGERRTVEVVDDQHGQPTWAPDAAERIVALGALPGAPARGVFHATGGGATTWYALAREVFRLVGADPARVLPIGSERLTRPARRPEWSVLGHRRWPEAGLPPMRHWSEALTEALTAAPGSAALGALPRTKGC